MSSISAGTTTNTALVQTADTTGDLSLQNSGVTSVTVKASGNVGIGTSSPSYKLDVNGDSLLIYTGSARSIVGNADKTNYSITDAAGQLVSNWYNGYVWKTVGGTERMRIDSSGNMLLGTTTVNGVGTTFVNQAANVGAPYINLNKSYSGAATALNFAYNGTQVGYIIYSDTTTAYVSVSDYRLKESIAPMTGALAKVAALKPVTYNWKKDGSAGQGFIAHELQEVVPDCVTGEKDEVQTVDDLDAEGKKIGTKEVPKYQGVDTSFLVATLTAAIQEQQAIIVQLQADVAELKMSKS